MSTSSLNSNTVNPSAIEAHEGNKIAVCLRQKGFGAIVTACPALDEPERRLALADFLCAVLAALGDRADASAEEFRGAIANFGEMLESSLRLGSAPGSLGIELYRLLHVLSMVAEEADDLELWQRALEWQACSRLSGSPRAQAYAVLADFLADRAGDTESSGKTWILAAREAELDASDRRVTLGYWERAFAILGEDPVVAEYLVLGYAFVGDWLQVSAPFGVMLRKAEGPAAVAHCIEILLALKQPAIEQRASVAYVTLIDEVLWSVSSDNAIHARALILAKAQVSGADPDRIDIAIDAYYALLESQGTDSDTDELLRFIQAQPDTRFRHDQTVRLYEWRIGRATDPLALLVQWAKLEETEFSDPRAAAALFERILTQDPSNAQALREIRRLRQAELDWDGVELALGRLSDLVEDPERSQVDLDRADVLSSKLGCHEAALEIVTLALSRGTDSQSAQVLLANLLATDDSEIRLSAGERLVSITGPGPVQRLDRIRHVLNATKDLASDGSLRGSLRASVLRREWYEQVVGAWPTADDEGFALAAEAVVEFPDSDALWQSLGQWSSDPARAREIVALYGQAVERTLDRELVERLGKKMLAFAESAHVDVAIVLEVLMKVVRLAPGAGWALDRVKMHLGAQGRWIDLLELYECAMDEAHANNDAKSEMHLLTEASVTAKDLANDTNRAIRYFERIVELNPDDARTDAALERLYERSGYTERLATHLSRRVDNLAGADLRQLQERIAVLWIDAGRPDPALEIVRNELYARGDWAASVRLLERIFEMPESRTSGAAEVSTAEMAAQLLLTVHRKSGRHAELTRLLREVIPVVGDLRRKLPLLTDLAQTLEASLNEESTAFEVVGELLRLDPAQQSHRAWLAKLGTSLGRPDERVRFLLEAAEPLPLGDVKARLLVDAAQVTRDVLGNSVRAVELLGQVVECGTEAEELMVDALAALDPLLQLLGHSEERCNVLECLADATGNVTERVQALRTAAQLAAEVLNDVERAATNWRALLDEDPDDAEALEGFIVALELQERWQDLAQTLSYRINITGDPHSTVPDRKRLAAVHANCLGELDAAIDEWTGLLADNPRDYESRDNISKVLTDGARWAELVNHLTSHVALASDPALILRHLAEVQRNHLGDIRAAAVALLQAGDLLEAAAQLTDGQGSQLDDASLRLDLAQALVANCHGTEATAVLLPQVALYGDRKPKERSVVHLELARAWMAKSEPERALEQLGVAISIDPTNADILATHGKLSYESGVLASAEQSYRALLLLAMHSGNNQGNLPALAVLYFRLAQIAERRSDRDRADELIASAFDAAQNQPSQMRELEQALIEARADELLPKTLDYQLGRAKSVEQSAEILMDFATRRLQLGEPSAQLLSRLRDRADQISSTLSVETSPEVVLNAHGPLVAVYRLLGDTECVLALLLTWTRKYEGTNESFLLEIESAKLMLEFPERRAEGIEALLTAWSRDKTRDDVADALSVALSAEGRFEEQCGLLTERIAKVERARKPEHANGLRLELGKLCERLGKLNDAANAYESVAAATGSQKRLALEALSRVLGELQSDPERLCRILESLLEISEGRSAAETALRLAQELSRVGAGSASTPDYLAIERALGQGFAQDPTFDTLRESFVRHYRERGQFSQARNILELALARLPRNRKLALELADLSEAAADEGGALEALESALTCLPEDAELNRRRWQLLIRAGRQEEALAALEREHVRGTVSSLELATLIRELEMAQDSRALRFREIELLLSAKAEGDARERLAEWLRKHDDDVDGFRELARLAVKARSWQEAAQALSRLVQIDKPEGMVAAALDLAIACDKLSEPARAIPSLEQAKRSVAEHAELEQRLLKSYEATEMHDRIAALYVEQSERPKAAMQRASLLEQAANHFLLANLPSQALVNLDAALALDPERLSLVVAKLHALREMSERERAIELVLEHLTGNRHSRNKERYRLFEELGNLHLEQDDLVEAFEAFAQAHKLDRAQPRIALMLGLVAADLDDAATASGALRAAVAAVRPHDNNLLLTPGERAAAYAELSRLQFLRGSQSTARQFFDKAVEEDPNHHAVINLARAMSRP